MLARARPNSMVLAIAILIVAGGLGAGLAWRWSSLRPAVYAASATLLVHTAAVDSDPAHPSDAARAPAIAAISISTPRLVAAARGLSLVQPITVLANGLSARAADQTPFFTITARAADPATAADLANALAALAAKTSVVASEADASTVSLIDPATTPISQEYTRLPLDLATGAFAGVALALATLLPSRRRSLPRRVRGVGGSAELWVGVFVAILIIGSLAVDTPDAIDRVISLAATALAAVSPAAGLATLAIVVPLPDSGAFGPITLDLLLIAGISYGTVLRAIIERSVPSFGTRSLAVVVYIGLAMLASIPALNGLSGDQASSTISHFLQLGAGLMLVLAAGLHFSRHDARPYVVLVVISAAMAATLGLIQLAAPNLQGLPAAGLFAPADVVNPARPSGPFINANYFGLYMALGLVAAVGGLLGMRYLRGVLLVCVPPIALALALASNSRGALLAAGIGLLATLWVFTPRRVALAGGAVILVVSAILYPTFQQVRLDRTARGSVAAAQIGLSESDQERLDAVTAAIPLFAIDPVFGIGFGRYSFESTRYVGSSFATAAHNQYLDILAEQGLVGIAAFAGLVAALGASLWRQAHSSLGGLAIAMAVTYLAACLVLEPLTTIQTSGTFWLVVGAGIAGVRARDWRTGMAREPESSSQLIPQAEASL